MGKLLKAQTTEKAPYLSVICCNYDHHTTTDNIICINCRAIFYILQQGNTGSSHLDISIRDISLLATITSFICKPPSLRSKKRVFLWWGYSARDVQCVRTCQISWKAHQHGGDLWPSACLRCSTKKCLISKSINCEGLNMRWKKNGENPGPPGTGAMQVSCHGPMWSIVNQYLWRHSNGKWWKG